MSAATFFYAHRSNLAGHHTITGDLPDEWYDQSKFPKLFYLKLKGTQIVPDLSPVRLTWYDANYPDPNIQTTPDPNSPYPNYPPGQSYANRECERLWVTFQ